MHKAVRRKAMKALVVYYSRTGNTKRVAEVLVEALRQRKCDATLEEIVERKDRSGLLGWLRAGRDATLNKETEIEEMKNDAAEFDVVVVGTPVWAFTATPAVVTFLCRYGGKIKKAAFFCTLNSKGARRALARMGKVSGKNPIAEAAFYAKSIKKGEFVKEVEDFARSLIEKAVEGA